MLLVEKREGGGEKKGETPSWIEISIVASCTVTH
jgi:hypothetical protein